MSVTVPELVDWLEPRLHRGVVKICGLREPEHAVAAVAAGADLIGFVFAPTRRQVTAATARACITAARAASDRQFRAVGVFVDAPADLINETADAAGLDLIQLHGNEGAGFATTLNRPVIWSVKPPPGATTDFVSGQLAARLAAAAPVLCLLDGYDPKAPGGTGQRADWTLAARLARQHRLLLAGGLDPVNVADAIRQVDPIGVDVSSGVETDGIKDPAKIRAFVTAARTAFASRLI